MELHKTINLTNNLQLLVGGYQLGTYIVFKELGGVGEISLFLDVDRWTEFKKHIQSIDSEFMKRFKYTYST